MESGLLLDVVVGQGPAVLELLSGEDQSLLVRGDTLLVLDLGLDCGFKEMRRERYVVRICRVTQGVVCQRDDVPLSMVSEVSTSRVMVLPVRVLTAIACGDACMICQSSWIEGGFEDS